MHATAPGSKNYCKKISDFWLKCRIQQEPKEFMAGKWCRIHQEKGNFQLESLTVVEGNHVISCKKWVLFQPRYQLQQEAKFQATDNQHTNFGIQPDIQVGTPHFHLHDTTHTRKYFQLESTFTV